jgi:hypothetical protein
MCAQAMLLSMVYKVLDVLSCHASKCFSASAKWLVLDDLRRSAACKHLDDD